MDNFHKTLQRQIKKYLGENFKIPPELLILLQAISDTYKHADDDRVLIERSMEISSKELIEINTKLVQEASLIKATFESTADGILIVDQKGKILNWNTKFLKLWDIPEDVISTYQDEKALEFVMYQLADPEEFINKVKNLYQNPDQECMDTLEFKDGRIFERYSQPMRIDGLSMARVWSFRDITKQKQAENQLVNRNNELENINRLMVDRELRMIELKKIITELRNEIETLKKPQA